MAPLDEGVPGLWLDGHPQRPPSDDGGVRAAGRPGHDPGRSARARRARTLLVRSGVKRTAFAEEPRTTIIAVGGVPGRSRSHPQYAEPLYNLAYCESLAGRTADAVEHLRRAIDTSEPAFKELVGGRAASDFAVVNELSARCARRP
jgi:hypothetical protein